MLHKFLKLKPSLSKYRFHLVIALITATITSLIAFNLGVTTSYHRISDWVLGKNITSIGEIFSEQFNNKYIVTAEHIGNIDVFVAYSNTSPNSLAEDADPYDKKASPLIIVQDSQNKKIKRIYEISFNSEENHNNYSGNIISPKRVEFIDLDGDLSKELLTEWTMSEGGSGGLVGMIAFKKEGDDLFPSLAYPTKVATPIEKASMRLTEKVENKILEGPIIGRSEFTKLTDLNGDKKPEFLYGNYEWLVGEAHFGEHYWNLQVFELKDGKYQNANWWNGGKTLKTSKKYGFFESQDFPSIQELMAEFNSNITCLAESPVSIKEEDSDGMKSDAVGQKFDPVELGKDLYNYDNEKSPWQIEELDIDGDLKKEKVYYGKVAMNHTPHVAYVVKDGVVIFYAGGANVQLEQASNGFLVHVTLDWNIDKYETTKYEKVNGEYKPVWYQITCGTD